MQLDVATVPHLRAVLQRQARGNPDRMAIAAAGRPGLTYGRWYALAVDAEATLRAAGVAAHDRIAIVLPSGADMVSATVALSAVAVLALLNPEMPEPELDAALRQFGATCVAVPAGGSAPARAVAHRLGLRLIEVSSDVASGTLTLRCPHRLTRNQHASPTDVSFLWRTSGTTGAAKPVAITTANLLSSAEALGTAFALSADDRCLLVQQTSQPSAMLTLSTVLLKGSSIVYMPSFDAGSFFATLESGGITWLSAPPATHREVLTQVSTRPGSARAAQLRFLRTGAATLERDIWERLEGAFGAPLLQVYGMSEVPSIACLPFPSRRDKIGTVGRPTGCEIAIVDDRGRELIAGEAGEVVVRGPNVFRGYDDPAANAGAFVDGWFRTGDFGRCDGDGYLTILGRRKETINRGGQTIFPYDVESLLRSDERIRDVAVFGVSHPTLGEEVAAAVIAEPHEALTEGDVRRIAAQRVAAAVAPKHVLIVHEFPRTASGKVQRHVLRTALDEREARIRDRRARPTTLLEAHVLEAFEEILELANLGIDADFFATGGDSLRAARLIARLQSCFGERLTIQTLFDSPTPRTLAHVGSDAAVAATPLVCVQVGRKSTPLFFLNGDIDGSGVYVRHLARELDPDRTVYMLPPHTVRAGEPGSSIETMAADYVALVANVWPGPYLIGGYCNGGVVAYEMAQLWRAAGARVGPLLLLAATASNGPYGGLHRSVRTAASILGWSPEREFRWFRRLRARAIELSRMRDGSYTALLGETLHRFVRPLRSGGTPETPTNSDAFERMSEVLARYVPGPYGGPVHHFWPEDDVPQITGDPTMGWGAVAGNLVLHRVRGDHFSVVTRHVGDLARAMRPLLSGYE